MLQRDVFKQQTVSETVRLQVAGTSQVFGCQSVGGKRGRFVHVSGIGLPGATPHGTRSCVLLRLAAIGPIGFGATRSAGSESQAWKPACGGEVKSENVVVVTFLGYIL